MSSIELSFARGRGLQQSTVWVCPDLSRPDKEQAGGTVYRLSAYGALVATSESPLVMAAVKEKFSYIPSAVTRNGSDALRFMAEALGSNDDEDDNPTSAIAWILGTKVYALASGDMAVYLCPAGKTASSISGEAPIHRGDIVAVAPAGLEGEPLASLVNQAAAVVSIQNGPVEIIKAPAVSTPVDTGSDESGNAPTDSTDTDEATSPLSTEDAATDAAPAIEEPMQPRRKRRMLLFAIAALVIIAVIGWITYGASVDEEIAEVAAVDSITPVATVDTVAVQTPEVSKVEVDTLQSNIPEEPKATIPSEKPKASKAVSEPRINPENEENAETQPAKELTRGTNYSIEPGTLDED